MTTHVSYWRDDSAQIDLVIDRADNCINLCEVKLHSTTCTMTAADAAELERKKAAFLAAAQSRKALFLT